jgi:hypothetical protein
VRPRCLPRLAALFSILTYLIEFELYRSRKKAVMQQMEARGAREGRKRRRRHPTPEEVVDRLRDDGDFDSLRLSLIRKLKHNVCSLNHSLTHLPSPPSLSEVICMLLFFNKCLTRSLGCMTSFLN